MVQSCLLAVHICTAVYDAHVLMPINNDWLSSGGRRMFEHVHTHTVVKRYGLDKDSRGVGVRLFHKHCNTLYWCISEACTIDSALGYVRADTVCV